MENELQPVKTDSLMAELGSWNRQENQFRELFSADALKDREFLKMKLGEYDRIWYRYNGRAQTTDERAMLIMLRFQRRKMEKSLYPGLLTRLLYRTFAMAKGLVAGEPLRSAKPESSLSRENYHMMQLPVRVNTVQNAHKEEATVRRMPDLRNNVQPRMKQRERQGKGPRIR